MASDHSPFHGCQNSTGGCMTVLSASACQVYLENGQPKTVCKCTHNMCQNGATCIPSECTL